MGFEGMSTGQEPQKRKKVDVPPPPQEPMEVVPLAEEIEEKSSKYPTLEAVESLEFEEQSMNFDSKDVKREIATYVTRMLEDDETFGTVAANPKERAAVIQKISANPELFSVVGDVKAAVNARRMPPTVAMTHIAAAFSKALDKEKVQRLRGSLGKK